MCKYKRKIHKNKNLRVKRKRRLYLTEKKRKIDRRARKKQRNNRMADKKIANPFTYFKPLVVRKIITIRDEKHKFYLVEKTFLYKDEELSVEDILRQNFFLCTFRENLIELTMSTANSIKDYLQQRTIRLARSKIRLRENKKLEEMNVFERKVCSLTAKKYKSYVRSRKQQ